MSGGIHQITIPEFDDDDLPSASTPFGRSGGFTFGASSGQESPILTPTAIYERSDRSYFHSRGDSVTSEDSTIAVGPFAHSSQTSLTATNPLVVKKTSFASFRNAFKSGKASEAPPVPSVDRQAYPALKNPFGRTATSLAHVPTPYTRRPSVTASPPHQRPHTPISNAHEPRHARGLSSKSKGHSYARSQHSHTGSTFHSSDNGSDHSHGFGHGTPRQSTPPPVPRMPNEFGGQLLRIGTPPLADFDEKIVMDPRTPSDYALHAVFIRFATAAEEKIDKFLKQGLDRDPPLSELMGPNVDPKFDDLLSSLGRIAMKHTKPVVDSIMRWRKTHKESISGDIVRYHSSHAYASGRVIRGQEVIVILNERLSLASIYIMCRALIVVVQSISKDALGEVMGNSLEEITFEQFKRPDWKLLTQSANHRTNAELYATLLGQISSLRFVSVTDRFLSELGPLASGQVPKDFDMKYENLVKGLRRIHIKVWPPESFEEGAEFLESLSKSFENAHGLRLKTTFAETLVQLLHPIGKTAQAEVNHPLWAKAVETIYPRARDMMNKPRYWHVAYPLVVTSLCVAPHEYFLRHWMSCFEAGLVKLKEKPYRIPVMNGMMRLIWTYLYRCHEPVSTSTAKLETLLKHFFPATRLTVYPHDEHLDAFVYIIHFVLSRHFEFGRDLTLNLMQEQHIRSSQPGNITSHMAPERTNIALEAILLSLHLVEREESAPAWPSNSDFSVLPNKADYPSSSDFCPPSFMQKPGMQEFFDRCGSTVGAVAMACAKAVGRMSIFDDQWSISRLNAVYEEAVNYVIPKHPEANVAYPASLTPQITMLHTCFSSWPRCLHPSLPLDDALDMLIRGIVHVEPAIGDAASLALQRFAADATQTSHVISRFATFLFSPKHIVNEGSGTRLAVESARVLSVWFTVVDTWANSLVQRSVDSFEETDAALVTLQLNEIEAGAIFLLSFNSRSIRAIAIKLIRVLEAVVLHLYNKQPSPFFGVSGQAFPVLDLILGKGLPRHYFDQHEEALDTSQRARLSRWRLANYSDGLLRLAESDDEKDRVLWRFVFPSFIRTCLNYQAGALASCRETWSAAISRYHPLIASVSGINNRLQTSQPNRSPVSLTREREKTIAENLPVIEQWHFWVKLVCCTASAGDGRPAIKREHSRAPSDLSYERERMTTTRGLFRYLTPFLDSDSSIFRETAVMSISSFPSNSYSQLLEDLSAFAARHFYDDARTKVSTPPGRRNRRQDRLYLAVAHIYQLTGPFLKEQRGIARQDSLTNVLKFVRHTQMFLSSPDIRSDWQQQRLRRYFCGIVEHLFDGLATLQASDRFIPANMHLTLYRLCEGWCQCGNQSEPVMQRLVDMQTAATAGFAESQHKAAAIEKFQTETRLLSHAAVGAMASLCQKAFFPSGISSSSSPTDRASADFLLPLEVVPTLDRIVAMLASIHEAVNDGGRKALRSLLTHTGGSEAFLEDVLRRSFVTSREPNTSNCRFFEVVADVVCNAEVHQFTFGHVLCTGFLNLCSPLADTRQQAFNALEAIHIKAGGQQAMSQFESTVRSSAPNVHLDAQSQIAEFLAKQHREEAVNVLAQCSVRLPLVHESLACYASSRFLHSLVPWMSEIELTTEDKSAVSTKGRMILYYLVTLTLRYSEAHPEQIQSLWIRLVEHSHAPNGQTIVRFLLEQSPKVGCTAFVNCARQIVAFLSRTSANRQTFENLCGIIDPAQMLPNMDYKTVQANAEKPDTWSALESLFAEQPRHTLGAGQFAMMFLTDVVPFRAWEYKKQLPILLHAIFTHIDHRNPFLREHARRMLFQTLRSWMPGYDEMPDRSGYQPLLTFKSAIGKLERESDSTFWSEEDTVSRICSRMKDLCIHVLEWLEPLHSTLAMDWGSLALHWGTACSIRGIAFRSLQVFRALMPRVTQSDLALLLGRLSNTIAAPDANIQSFTAEIILTLQSLAKSGNLDPSLLPTMFWCTHACLSTPVEAEFGQIVDLLDCLLDKLDLDDPYTTEVLNAHKPSDWTEETSGIQPLLLVGMRSIVTSSRTLKVVKRLAKMENPALIDPSDSRLRDMYTLCLPWCLRAMESNSTDESLIEFANNIGQIAEEDGLSSIARIMTSFVKARFRTKEDFLRQAAAALREHYASDHWTEVVSLLLSLVLNQERWLQIKSMQILKVLFQLRETRNPVDRLGSEFLMPLLRLIQTDLANQALEVLEEPLAISGGPAAKNVLRMSMHTKASPKEVEAVGDVFGMPDASGWCIASPDRQREICRANVIAVFDTCKVPTRPSRIEFEPEVDQFADPLETDLGDLVQNLHELSTFFQEGQPKTVQPPLPSHQLEARVAAILAKSTDTLGLDSPQTPFVDVFHIAGLPDFEDSDEDSDSDHVTDTFAFDSVVSLPINGRNGF